MASDIKIIYREDLGEFDIKYANGDLYREEGMTTSVLMSLLCDRRTNDDDVLINENDKRGWWGDLLEDDGDKIGSRLWLLRGKTDQDSLNFAKETIKECLQWLVNDGVWQYFDVETYKIGEPSNYILGFSIDAHYSNGQKVSYKFKGLWENELNLTIV